MSNAVLVISICLITWTVFTLMIRVYMRRKVNGPWGYDDWVAALGTIELAVSILYLLSVASSRISTGLLLERLERKRVNTICIRAANTASSLWLLAGVIALGVYERRGCATSFPLWCGLEAISIVLEVLTLLFVVILVWDLRMAFKQKTIVLISFATRIITVPAIALRLVSMDKSTCSNQTFGSDTVYTIISLVTIHVSIMVATFSCIKQFLGAFDTGAFGTGTIDKAVTSHIKSYEMVSQVSAKSTKGHLRVASEPENRSLQLRPDNAGYTVTEIESQQTQGGMEASSIASDASERAIITKTQQWDVTDGKENRI
ncbi:hypothetical protein B9Z65_3294 [Elsinoe australis]|uniref:Uncharacterized protein n=1 Tax=Elsinoe australis TaxID=40998 RepID=A0A2P7ZXZ1_9PEZI|nr:hypothetical protein B9Z65_3294 [Elsinoe australis]